MKTGISIPVLTGILGLGIILSACSRVPAVKVEGLKAGMTTNEAVSVVGPPTEIKTVSSTRQIYFYRRIPANIVLLFEHGKLRMADYSEPRTF